MKLKVQNLNALELYFIIILKRLNNQKNITNKKRKFTINIESCTREQKFLYVLKLSFSQGTQLKRSKIIFALEFYEIELDILIILKMLQMIKNYFLK
jgi:hypothetical protein